MTIKIDQKFKNLLPPLTSEQQQGLEQDLLKHGCLEYLITWNGTLIDGHHRYDICQKHDISFEVKEMQFASELETMYWAWNNQKNRRNISKYELGKQALMFEPLFKEQAKERQSLGGQLKGKLPPMLAEAIESRDKVAEVAGLSHGTIDKIKTIEATAPAELKQKLVKQEISINQAYQQVRANEKRKMVENKQKETVDQQDNSIDIYKIAKKYNIIYADPPWSYYAGGHKNQSLHYKGMSIEEICKLPVQSISNQNCILFLWVTYPILKEAFNVIEAWGFKYSTCGFCWIKKNKNGSNFFGLGNWTRANTELCLIATKGSIIRLDAGISQVIESQIEEHSKKPDIVKNKIIQLVGNLPKIELFARQKTDDWDCWGNEV